MTPSRRLFLISGLVAALAAYLPTLGHPFQYDDEAKIVTNPRLANPGELLAALDRPGYSEDKGRSLAWASLALDRRLHGLAPAGWNATSLVLHLVNVLLLFGFGRALLARGGRPDSLAPAIAAALFAVHPLASEAVLYLNARGNLLATGFYLAALATLIGVRGRSAPAAFAVLGALALLSKEIAISLAALAPLVWLASAPRAATTPAQDTDPGFEATRRSRAFALAAVAIGGTALAAWSGALARAWELFPGPVTLITQARALVTSLALTLVPLPRFLSVDHGPAPALDGPSAWLAGLAASALVAALALAAFALRRRQPALALLLAWPLLTHAPTSLFPRAEWWVEYRAYLPLTGSLLLAGLALERWPRVALGLVPLLATLTAIRAQAWETPTALWADAATKSPHSARALNNLGSALEQSSELERAIESYRAAVALAPEHALARYNLGTALVRGGRLAAGIHELGEALRLRPTLARARYNRGRALEAAGRVSEGRAEVARALAEAPSLATPREPALAPAPELSTPWSGN